MVQDESIPENTKFLFLILHLLLMLQTQNIPEISEEYELFPLENLISSQPFTKNPQLLTSIKSLDRETVAILESLGVLDTNDLKNLLDSKGKFQLLEYFSENQLQHIRAIMKKKEISFDFSLIDQNQFFFHVTQDTVWILSAYWNEILMVFKTSNLNQLIKKFHAMKSKIKPTEFFYVVPDQISKYFPKNNLHQIAPITSNDEIKRYLEKKGVELELSPKNIPLALAVIVNFI